MIVEGDGSF